MVLTFIVSARNYIVTLIWKFASVFVEIKRCLINAAIFSEVSTLTHCFGDRPRILSPSWISSVLWSDYHAMPTINLAAGPSLLFFCNLVDPFSVFLVFLWRYSPHSLSLKLPAGRCSPQAGQNYVCSFMFFGLCHSYLSCWLSSRLVILSPEAGFPDLF